MAMTSNSPQGGVRCEINVTPLIDVVLVLLIIFMVVTPMLQQDREVQLPKAAAHEDAEPVKEPFMITMTHDGKLWRNNVETTLDTIRAEVASTRISSPGTPYLLRGDKRLKVGDVKELMRELREAGATGVALAIESEKESP